jgi:CheY-like chemotaxis protein
VGAVLIDPQPMNAEQLARSRLIQSTPPSTPLVILADARATSKDLATYGRLGASRVLQNPVRRVDLRDVLHQVLGGGLQQNLEASPVRKAGTGRPRRIMVVDDAPENRVLFNAFLRNVFVEVTFGENGSQAVELFRRNEFDMVFLDLEMPEMDGLTAIREMRAWEKAHGREPTPVVSISAHSGEERREEATQAGFTSHLNKPLRKKDFLRMLETTGPLETRDTPVPRNISSEFFNLRPAYLNQQRQQARMVQQWLGERRYDEIRRAAQKMKGSAGAYGLTEISRIGEELEYAASRSDSDAIRQLVGQLEVSIARHLPAA